MPPGCYCGTNVQGEHPAQRNNPLSVHTRVAGRRREVVVTDSAKASPPQLNATKRKKQDAHAISMALSHAPGVAGGLYPDGNGPPVCHPPHSPGDPGAGRYKVAHPRGHAHRHPHRDGHPLPHPFVVVGDSGDTNGRCPFPCYINPHERTSTNIKTVL